LFLAVPVLSAARADNFAIGFFAQLSLLLRLAHFAFFFFK